MASSSASDSSLMRTSSSEEDLKQIMDDRKRKRMESNRESARRSRMRKQNQLNDLTAQVSELKREKNDIINNTNITYQRYLSLEAENSVLRAQMAELNTRLRSLDEIIGSINSSNKSALFGVQYQVNDESFMDPWKVASFCLNQPVIGSTEMIMY